MKSQFDFGTIIGLVAGLLCIFVSMIWPEVDRGDIVLSTGDSWRFEQLIWFYQPQSVFIVLGGVISATLVNYPIKAVINMGNVFKNVVLSEKFDFTGTIDKIVVLAEKSRKDGLLSLEAGLKDIESVFLRNGIELAINERDSNRLRTFLTMDLNNISTRHIGAQEIILYMAAYAPAFGMLGTVLGLIIMMNKFQMSGETSSIDFNVADQFSALLVGMGTALITTFYGVFLANMVFLPIAGKLKRRSENEIMLKSIVLEGIISIHGREHPILIKEKLMTFVAMSERNALEEKEK
ncbi:MAG: MotA/TolQ/ExbB proton channel family protein [bacterium]|jgi:chemotaxis protein MotA|nr:MAG: motility protein A [bacterium]|tara:strand:- start:804 stop:1682 length:879 start_codon:yes stop_codon:yes gene_type:complete